MRLSFDTARCLGTGPDSPRSVRDNCARYVQRDAHTGPRTPYVRWLCFDDCCDSQIEVVAVEVAE